MSINFSETENHQHTGGDAPRLNPKYFLGFPVYKEDTALDFNTIEGTIALRHKSDDTYYLTAFVNGGWREIELT